MRNFWCRQFVVFALATFNLSVPSLFAQGTVTEVAGGEAVVRIASGSRPVAGDTVEIYFKLAGSDEEVSVASGRVVSVANDTVKVKIEDATGEVTKDQLARFKSRDGNTTGPPPGPIPSVAATPSPTQTLPPSIPFTAATPASTPGPPVKTGLDPAALALANKALTQYSAGDIAGAIASNTAAIQIAPNAAILYLNRANAYLFKPDFRAAIADANKALELKVEKADDAYVIRGAAQAGLGNFDAGIADCNRALKINPNHVVAYKNRSNNKIRKRNYSGALADCNKVIALDPKQALGYYNRGFAYVNLGDRTKAIADWRKAIALQPALGAELNPLIVQYGGGTKQKR